MLKSKKVYKHFVDQDESLCAINLFKDNGVIEVAAPSRSVLYEGINVVTNYCKKLSVGDQLTGKIVRMSHKGTCEYRRRCKAFMVAIQRN